MPPSTRNGGSTGWGAARSGRSSATSSPPACSTRTLPGLGTKPSQTSGPPTPKAPLNLWRPADGSSGRDFGAHGAFDAKAVDRSSQVWLSQRHGLLAAFGGVLAGLVGLRLWRR